MSTKACYPDKAPIVNDLLETLCHPVRREIIYYFEQTVESEDAALDELVGRLVERMPSQTDEQLRVTLRHRHLPKLADRGWVEYDPDTGQVVYTGHETAKQLLNEVHAIF